jgi:iron-sulfur cluster assembly accessory protein
MAISEQEIEPKAVPTFTPVVTVTESAAARLQAMMKERALSDYGLRVFVAGGGCSGLQYGMTFDNEERPGDTVWEVGGLKLMVDPVSAGYIKGAVISYQQDNMLQGAFKIDNPNAVASCGCGHSFRPKNEQAAEDYEGYDSGYAGGGCGHCGHG